VEDLRGGGNRTRIAFFGHRKSTSKKKKENRYEVYNPPEGRNETEKNAGLPLSDGKKDRLIK